MAFRGRKTTPVDRAWLEKNDHRVAIDVRELSQGWKIDGSQGYKIIRDMADMRSDVINVRASGLTILGCRMVKLVIAREHSLEAAFREVAMLWRAVTGRELTLMTSGNPNETDGFV